MRCNDAKCDPTGRLWVGTMPLDWGPMTGTLYSLDAADRPVPRLRELGCSNGQAWNPTTRTFFFIETLKRRIERHHWDPATGDIAFERVLLDVPEADGLPDGMSIDTDGHLWVAFWGGGCVRRVHADTGEYLAQVNLPARQVTSCAFGGTQLDTLYITTAHINLSDEERAQQPLAGSVFVTQPGARGLPPDRCGWTLR